MALFFLTTIFLLFPAIQSQSCAPANHKITTLTSAPFWWLEVNPSYCVVQSSRAELYNSADGLQSDVTNNTGCMIIFSVCKQLPILCPNQGVCKIKGMSSNFQYISWPTNLGSVKYEEFKFSTDDKSLSIEYRNGDKMNCKGEQPVKTLITLNCNKNAKWNATVKKGMPFTGGAKAYPGRVAFDYEKCMFKLTFNSSEGCPNFSPVETEGHPLSIGSILLILFFPAVFLYCVIGGLINAGRNKSGTDVIPNYNFWKDLPYLVLDGFGFVFATITCSKVTTTTPRQPNSYQTM